MKIRGPSMLAAGYTCIIAASQASAQLTGISVESKPNEFGILVCNVYAEFDSPPAAFIVVGGAPFVSDRGMENRGSRPIWNAPDAVWEVKRNAWFGWPDFCAGKSVEDVAFRVPGHAQPRLLMDRPPKASGHPLASLPYARGAAGMELPPRGGVAP